MSEMPELVAAIIKEFEDSAKLLKRMAGIYPGDTDGSIMQDVYIYKYIVGMLDGEKWSEAMAEYEAERPKVTVTVYDAEGNIESESTG